MHNFALPFSTIFSTVQYIFWEFYRQYFPIIIKFWLLILSVTLPVAKLHVADVNSQSDIIDATWTCPHCATPPTVVPRPSCPAFVRQAQKLGVEAWERTCLNSSLFCVAQQSILEHGDRKWGCMRWWNIAMHKIKEASLSSVLSHQSLFVVGWARWFAQSSTTLQSRNNCELSRNLTRFPSEFRNYALMW